MRLFVAIRLPEPMKDALIRAQNDMYDRGVRGSFTLRENLHLTLAFIGEYPDVESALEALPAFEPFPLALEGLGCFGDLWWAGLRPSPPLEAVVRRLRRALAGSGIPFDRKRFSPHITLLRRASGSAAGLRIAPAATTVEAVSLMRSDRGRNGMIYTELGAIGAVPTADMKTP